MVLIENRWEKTIGSMILVKRVFQQQKIYIRNFDTYSIRENAGSEMRDRGCSFRMSVQAVECRF